MQADMYSYNNGGIPGQYPPPPVYPQAYELPPQSPTKKRGLLGKLGRGVTHVAHGLEKVATSENLERGIRGVAHGIERAAKSEFVANVGREFRTAVNNYEAQRAAAHQQQREAAQQTALTSQYQYEPEPEASPSPVAVTPSPEPQAQQAAPVVDGASLFADIPRVNGALYHDPSTLALAQMQRCDKLKNRFEQLHKQGATQEQLRPLYDEFMATNELYKQANEMQQKWLLTMAAMPMMRPMNSFGGFSGSTQMHNDTMSGIASLTAGSSSSGSGSYYNSNSYYGTNSYYGNGNSNTWSYSY